MQIIDPDQEQRTIALFRLGFRPFFLFAAVFSIIALCLWALVWFGITGFTPYGNWFWWHGHEMLFGFVAAVIVGFLLTAVQNWTGLRGLRGYPLGALFLLWLLARVILLFPGSLPNLLIAAIDVSFLGVAAAVMGYFVVRVRLWRNILFVPVLLLLAALNACMHWAAQENDLLMYKKAATAVVFLIVFLICLMGGRVIPMFTANGTQTQKVLPIKWLEITSLTSILLLILGAALNLNSNIMGFICLVAFVSLFVRTLRWRIWVTFAVPLVWSLHIACWFIVLGFAQLTLYHWGVINDYVSVLHTLTMGGIGLMILAMIARVSLGHTGRNLQAGRGLSLAFVAVIIATLIRSGLALLLPQMLPETDIVIIYGASIVLWVFGFSVFTIIYLPILTKARVDGRPG
jgi:uncharacterized protein involved in response to NO